ncbi:hypothetical protein E2C01_004572 [Portunus trituberculatus]|uniref:Uncharacterized protein n=1 Tax=Portunus trituberculatus TaxID=210409 RepID=A0A5B7CQ26_PORTR|nr:hypothetical protein [Portunus trituberculatus]
MLTCPSSGLLVPSLGPPPPPSLGLSSSFSSFFYPPTIFSESLFLVCVPLRFLSPVGVDRLTRRWYVRNADGPLFSQPLVSFALHSRHFQRPS